VVPSSTSATGPLPPPLFFAFRRRPLGVRVVLIIIIYQLPPETITDGREIVIWVLLDFGHTLNNSLRRSRNKRHPVLYPRPADASTHTRYSGTHTPMILLLLLLLLLSSSPFSRRINPFYLSHSKHTHPQTLSPLDLSAAVVAGRALTIIIIRLRVGVYGFLFPPSRDDDETSGDRYVFVKKPNFSNRRFLKTDTYTV